MQDQEFVAIDPGQDLALMIEQRSEEGEEAKVKVAKIAVAATKKIENTAQKTKPRKRKRNIKKIETDRDLHLVLIRDRISCKFNQFNSCG